jgi:hypothetical protein
MIVEGFAAAAIGWAVEQVLASLTSDRACAVVVENHSDAVWTKVSDALDDGEWKEAPDTRIPAQSTLVCSAQSTSVAGVHSAVEGTLVYSANNTSFAAYFDNPILGSNNSNLTCAGTNAQGYHRVWEAGHGDKPQMRFELFQVTFRDLPAVSGVPSFIQSNFGFRGNFELITPLKAGGLAHFWRDNDAEGNWASGGVFGNANTLGQVAVSLIQSNYLDVTFPIPRGHLELAVAVISTDPSSFHVGACYSFWRTSQDPWTWNGPAPIIGAVSGNPAMIQSTFGQKGNFELVAPVIQGGLAHVWRDNDRGANWVMPATLFGSGFPQGFDDAALIQSNYVDAPFGRGHLEVVARLGNRLFHFFRTSTEFRWSDAALIGPATNVSGSPAFIQSKFGAQGNFEVVYPLRSGGLAHVWRDNDHGANWVGPPTVLGSELGRVDAVAMIESNYFDPGTDGPGHLEVIARAGPSLYFFWRDSTHFVWNGPSPIRTASW